MIATAGSGNNNLCHNIEITGQGERPVRHLDCAFTGSSMQNLFRKTVPNEAGGAPTVLNRSCLLQRQPYYCGEGALTRHLRLNQGDSTEARQI
jgi:hypothetical protein